MTNKYEDSYEPLSPYELTGGIMFEKFSDLARRAVVMSQEVARGLGHDYIGTPHLLVALSELTDHTTQQDSLSRTILIGLEYTPETLRKQIKPGNVQTFYHIPFTTRATRAVEYALRESLQRGSARVEDIDLLLGVLRPYNDGPVAVSILTELGGDDAVAKFRKAVAQRVENVSVTPGEPIRKQEFIRILIPRDKVPEDGVKLIEQINDNLVDYSVEDLQRILQFVKESRLRIASY